MAYDNTNKGVLFRNERRQNDKQPEYTGNINFDGTDCWLNAWVKTDKNGRKYFSLSVKKKEPRGEESQADEFEEDVPF